MKVAILAGGFGTRISEDSHLKPKPMIEIGDMPILWHIMKHYSHYGFNDFIICAGYKQNVIKEYFSEYYLRKSNITFDFRDNNSMFVHNNIAEPWRVTILDTGLNTMTGGRIKQIKDFVGDETFMLTYGDGVSNVDINKLLKFHKDSGKIATITAIDVAQKFGVLEINENDQITSFREKKVTDGSKINGGFMVLEPKVFDYIDSNQTAFEKEPIENLAKDGELMAYCHNGFWQCMDTLRDRMYLEKLWAEGNAPWKTWED